MNTTLGRDKIWTPDLWDEIDKAVKAEIGQLRVAQRVFPSIDVAGSAVVPADRLDLENMSIEEGQTKPLIELSVEFRLTQSQVENEPTLHTGRTLARLAAKSIALAEDAIIFQGRRANIPGVRTVNLESAEDGLLGVATRPLVINSSARDFPQSVFRGVSSGIATLNSLGQPGPYALILESTVYADTYSPLGVTLVTTADRIIPLVPGGYYASGNLLEPQAGGGGPLRTGLLVSLGGEPTTIYIGVDAVTAFTQADTEGNFRFRVFERLQFVARDPRAFVRINIT